MRAWTERSLTARTTFLFGLIACVVIGALGTFVYLSVRMSMERQVDQMLAGRSGRFSELVRTLYTVSELKQRPLLFANMMGAEQDVLIFRRRGEPAYIEVNPARIAVPELYPEDGRATAVTSASRPGLGVFPVRWRLARTVAREDGMAVDIIVGHLMYHEMRMLAEHRDRTIGATLIGMLAATGLAYAVLKRGLRPVRDFARQAERISPASLDVRLDGRAAPVELRHLAAAVNAMLDRLEGGYQRLSQFSADLAHEIRTPVGILIGETQVALHQPRTSAEYQQVLESNLEELNQLRHIAENILFLSQTEHGTLSIGRVPITLADELHKIADYFEGIADERGMRFEVAAAGLVSANPDLCRRAINNLVVNAVRHGAEATVVRLSGTEDAGGTSIVVENRGAPLPPEQLGRLFDRFYRADAARSAYTESNGLGLAIVRAIMQLHGGTAEVSCPEHGLMRFELRFPKAAAQA